MLAAAAAAAAARLPFCLPDGADQAQFLDANLSIFHFHGEPAIFERGAWNAFLARVVAAPTLTDLSAVDLERALEELMVVNGVSCTQRNLRIKLRALFVSVFVKRKLFFFFRDAPVPPRVLLEVAQAELFALLPNLVAAPDPRESLVAFYIVAREIKAWRPARPNAGWKRFAMYTACLAAGDGVWYRPGRTVTRATQRRIDILQHVTEPRPAAGHALRAVHYDGRAAADDNDDDDDNEAFFQSMVELVNILETYDKYHIA